VINRDDAVNARSDIFIADFLPTSIIDFEFSEDTLTRVNQHVLAQNPYTNGFLTGGNDSLFILDDDLTELYVVDYDNFSKFNQKYPISDIHFDADSSTIYLPHYSNRSTLRLSYNEEAQLDSLGRFDTISSDPQTPGQLYVGIDNEILISSNHGASFNSFFTMNESIQGLYKKPDSNKLFVLLTNELVWIDLESKSITSILNILVSNEPTPDIPQTIALHQNYPNPFNPSTTISYQLTANSFITLKIFDALGREIAVLENGIKSPGNHVATFNANNLSSGIYYYVLDAADLNHRIIKKMTLIK